MRTMVRAVVRIVVRTVVRAPVHTIHERAYSPEVSLHCVVYAMFGGFAELLNLRNVLVD